VRRKEISGKETCAVAVEVSMPQMGESIAEGTLVKWHKKVGDKVRRDEPLFEISTDKVDTEVPSPSDGYVVRILVKEGETVAVHTVVGLIGESPAVVLQGAEPPRDARAPAAEVAPVALAPDEPARREGADNADFATIAPPRFSPHEERSPRLGLLRERSSPLIRRLAAEKGVDLSRITGTGIAGRVTKEDLLHHLEEAGTEAPAAAEPACAAIDSSPRPEAPAVARPAEEPGPAKVETSPEPDLLEGQGSVEPLSVMRQRIAEHMVLSRRTSPHATTLFEVDMTAVRQLKDWLAPQLRERHQIHLTYMPFLVQAVARALRQHPALNASVEGKNVRFHAAINMGIAVALEHGLVVPVIRDADKKDILGLAQSLSSLSRRARSKELVPEDVRGGTFTITNPGVFGSLLGMPIIHQPQVAILCIGAVQKRPVVLPGTDAITVRSMAYLSLTFDHRLIDGAMADKFLAQIKSTLESGSFTGIVRSP
jgi:pyruvate dehydrogenase E2 component (dihydrolipoamide acetyltransferase)